MTQSLICSVKKCFWCSVCHAVSTLMLNIVLLLGDVRHRAVLGQIMAVVVEEMLARNITVI